RWPRDWSSDVCSSDLTLTLAVATRIARDEASIQRRLALAATERDRVYSALRRVSAIDVFPSVTNFILFRLHEGKPADVHARFVRSEERRVGKEWRWLW